MSREHRETEEILRAIFGEDFVMPEEDSTEEQTERKATPIPDSLISEEEKAQIAVIKAEVYKLRNIHSGRLVSLLLASKNDYAMLQYVMFTDHFSEMLKAVAGLNYVCNDMSVEDADKVAEKENMTVKEMVHIGMLNTILNK